MKLLILFFTTFALMAQTVKVAPYYTPGVGTQNLTTTATTDTSIDVLATGSGGVVTGGSGFGGVRMLMPRAGQVTKISIYLGDITNLNTLYFSNNACATSTSSACLTWTPTYTSAITGPFTASAVNTFFLAAPLAVNKWDALAVRAEWTQPHSLNLALLSSQLFPAVSGNGATTQPEACFSQLNAAKQSTFTVASMALIANAGCPVIGAFMPPPTVVGIGDSIIGSAPAPSDSVADAFPQAYPIPSTFSPMHFWLANYAGGPTTYQSMGWSGQTAVEEQTRFGTDVNPLGPHYVLIDGGVNDLSGCNSGTGCTGPQTTAIETAITSMMSAAQALGAIPIIMLIGPWNTPNGSNARHVSGDAINANTISVAPTYGAIVVDYRCLIGQFRAGGTAGNCWDYQAAYLYSDGLGIHPNQTGVGLIGALIASLVPSLSPGIAKGANGVAW